MASPLSTPIPRPSPSPSPSPANPPTFHPISQTQPGIYFTCQTCKKIVHVDGEKPLQESTLLAFNQAYHLGAPSSSPVTSAVDLLSESFVVLPANRLAATANLASTKPNIITPLTNATTPSTIASRTTPTSTPATPPSVSSTNFDKQVQSASRLLELVQSQVPTVTSPLCTHCSGSVMNELDRRIQELEHDREEYAACLKSLQTQPPFAEANRILEEKEAEDEEIELAKQERELEDKLLTLRKEKQALNFEYESLEVESAKLSEYETQFWREYEEYAIHLMQVTEEQAHMKNQIKNANEALEKMKRTNVFDDAFHISHDGHFATINGFRLGRLPSQPVEWAETSAGLGQVLLLLHTMARHTGYKFQKYRLMPMGSYSKMAKLDDLGTTYELYGSNDLILGRLFWYRRFDTALVWLLACIQEFGEYATQFDPKFQLKYLIKGDLIGDVSIKLQFNNDAKWTKALKYMLTNLKFLLAWCSTRKQA